jgi:predicted nucleic acid-binding Zn ribbon protein
MPWDDDSADEEWVDDDGDADDENEPRDDTLSCPTCRRAVHEDTQQCPHCGEWITPVDLRRRWMRWVWTAVVILLVLSLALVTGF